MKARTILLVAMLLIVAILVSACGGSNVSKEDQDAARATVDKMLHSSTYDEFISYFTAQNRSEMSNSSTWQGIWGNLSRDGLTIWRITEVKGGTDVVDVTTTNNFAPSTRMYRLILEDGEWLVNEIAIPD